MYDLGSKLKLIRQQRCITQKELASRINKSVSAVSSYESNAQLPPLDVLESIAFALHVSIDYLVGIEVKTTFTTENLTSDQSEIIELLLKEFSNSGSNETVLTAEQILIFQKLLRIFLSNKKGE